MAEITKYSNLPATEEGAMDRETESIATASKEDLPLQMKKELGLMDGVAIIVGIIVGSGIFISPTGVVQYTGSVGMSLIVWALTGVISLIGAVCYAELGTMIPKSGGDYAYINEAFGNLPSFLYLWVALLIIMPTGNLVIALTFANYILLPFFPHCEAAPDEAVRLMAAVVVCFLTWVNCTNVKWSTKIQDIFTVTKVFALLIIIGIGLYCLSTGRTENYQKPFEGTNWSISALATAFYQGLFSFAGWNYLNFVVEELKEPYKNLPRAILISLPLVTIVYFFTNVAYFVVLSPSEILSSPAVAVLFANKTMGMMAWIMPVFVACSTFGSLNGGIFASSRLFFVGARQGHLPSSLGLINYKTLTPVPALLFLLCVTLFMLISSNIQSLINYISFTESSFILLSIVSLLWMRFKQPDRTRPIKVYLLFPVVFFMVCIFLVVLPVLERPVELAVAMIVCASGIPIYYLAFICKGKFDWFSNFVDKLTRSVQILTYGLPENKND